MIEKTVKSNPVYRGSILNLRVDEVILPNGNLASREVVEHKGAVVILAVNHHHQILLVKQYRHAVEDVLIELPAGKLEENESPASCAYRELIEETGFKANNLTKIMEMIPSPGFCSEKIHLYLATDLEEDYLESDPDEFIDLITLDLDEAIQKLNNQLPNR